MNLLQIQRKFSTQNKCIAYLEKLRWNGKPTCPHCNSKMVYRRNKTNIWHCNHCNKDFTVLYDTIFEDTRLPLPKWFMVVGLMLNTKTGISAKEIQRNVGLTYKTAWYSAMRVRCAMIDYDNIELHGIVEMDEAYIGGKPRYRYKKGDNTPNLSKVTAKRGRGTKKTPIVGIVERGDKVVLKVIEKLTARNLMAMLKRFVDTKNALVVTDEFRSYRSFDDIVQHYTIQHKKKQYVKGLMHTNTIEGFWSIVKNSIKGNYIAISKKYLPLYLVQSQYVYNHRNYRGNLFEKFLKQAVRVDKTDYMEHYKPVKKDVKKLIYKPKNKRG